MPYMDFITGPPTSLYGIHTRTFGLPIVLTIAHMCLGVLCSWLHCTRGECCIKRLFVEQYL